MKIPVLALITAATTLFWIACKTDNNQKAEQGDATQDALNIRDMNKGGAVSSPAVQEALSNDAAAPSTATVPASGPHINGSNVIMRKEASIKSEKMGTFDVNEQVSILETKNVSNDNEGILAKAIPLYTSENQSGAVAMTLPKGKAVVIEQYHAEQNKYEVSYQAEGKGKLFATISADAVETISYSTWYRVKRANAEEGWVLGKFLKTQ